MALLTAITTCKGRLSHLKETLPDLARAPDIEVVVVDYDCPDGAADWVRSSWPDVRIVAVEDRPLFSASTARNLGAAAATADWLAFVDADVRVPVTFAQILGDLLQPGVFLVAKPRPAELWGALVVSRADFEAIGGYDEAFEGWGGEDVDIIERLKNAGLREAAFPSDDLSFIPHDPAMRSRFQEIQDLRLSGAINGFYRTVKNDLARQQTILDLDARRKLHADVRRAFTAPGGIKAFQVSFRQTTVWDVTINATLRYDLATAIPLR